MKEQIDGTTIGMKDKSDRRDSINTLEAIASRLEAIAIGFLLLVGWRP